MELNINELDEYNYDFDNISVEEIDYIPSKKSRSFEEIPENNFPKKKVHFNEPLKPINQAIPKMNAKMVRQHVVPVKPQISYDDILKKMGMFVVNGRLHLIEDNNKIKQQLRNNQENNYIQQNNYNQTNKQVNYNIEPNMNQNSYIYNKYFKEHGQSVENVKRPMTLMEYRRKLIKDILQKKRINEIKSTKLLFPTSNINISGGIRHPEDMNKLFNFSKR
jgi:hypothetical protein